MQNQTKSAAFAGLMLMAFLVIAPNASAVAKSPSVSTECSLTQAFADAVGSKPTAVAQMFGSTRDDQAWNDGTEAYEHVVGDQGSTATADNGSMHAHCNAHSTSDCTNMPELAVIGKVTDALAVPQITTYDGTISLLPLTGAYWFFGTSNHNGIVAPFATPLDSNGNLVLTQSSVPTAAPIGVSVINCMPVGVGLAS